MTWRDKLISATYKGVEFSLRDSARDGGRNKVIHEIVGRDFPIVEDTGIKQRTISVDGFVVGENYNIDRDRLISVLEEKSSPGIYSDPFLGNILVEPIDFSHTESLSGDGGIVNFSITFLRVDPDSQEGFIPVPSENISAVEAEMDALVAIAVGTVNDGYNQDLMPNFGYQSIENILEKISGLIIFYSNILKTTKESREFNKDNWFYLVNSIVVNSARYINDADGLSKVLAQIFSLIRIFSGDSRESYGFLRRLYNFSSDEILTETTDTRIQQKKNVDLVDGLIRTGVVAEAMVAAINIIYRSSKDLKTIQDEIYSEIDNITSNYAIDDGLFWALYNARAKFIVASQETIKILRNVKRINITSPVPAFLIDYWENESLSGEDDIIRENNIIHPGFVVGEIDVID